MASRLTWLRLRIEELFHVNKEPEEDGSEEGRETPKFRIKPSLELAMVVIDALLIIYLILGLLGKVPIF